MNVPVAAAGVSPDLRPEAAIVLRQFRVVFNAVKSHFQHIERQAGVGGAQLWALSVVAAHPGIGVGELAQKMDIHQSTTSNLVRALSLRGLLVSRRDEVDRRAVHLEVSVEGLALLARVPGPTAGVLPDALARLDDATLARLHDDLTTLICTLGEDEHGDAARTPLAQL
ncbi:MarR family winged helix-turn-helix transcriptional regulator [uncultured Aquabacterium sp.]|uniref:MarR family winged helix-turn-helix transcriptional regulator n=1 Tax=Aquabacterium sp. TaxID=1872578 RepID=UPI0025D0F1FF|nr:MarR family winged helix-turn-helix transcriptional regulator [uncultured Aquabacterium sp.]